MSKIISVMVVLSILFISAGCSRKPEKKPPPPPMKVGVARADQGEIVQTLDVSGNLTFLANTTVSAEVAAQVASIDVSDGQKVTQGQVLLVFDDTKIKESANQAQANLQKDEATLAFNKTDWEKNLELQRTGAISQTTYDQKFSTYQNSVGQVASDRAALAKAKEDLNKTKVISPITGVLSNRYIEKGDWVSEGGKLFQISDYTKIYLEAFLSDIDVGKLDIRKVTDGGVPSEVTVDSYPGQTFAGKLTYIQPVANVGRLFQTRIYLDNQEMKLLQGMFARGKIVVKVTRDVLRVPLEALLDQVRENAANTMFVVDNKNSAQLTRVKLGLIDDKYSQVVQGLKKGDTVVVRGKEILSSGQPVESVGVWESQTKAVD